MSFSKENINKIVYPKGTSLNVRAYPYITDPVKLKTGESVKNLIVNVKKGNPVGRTSGLFFAMKDGNWYQVMFYKPIGNRTYGYCRLDVITLITADNNKEGEKQGTKLMNDLITSDVKLYQNLLILAELSNSLGKKGVNVSSYEKRINEIIALYNERQKAIKDSGLIKTNNWVHEKWAWIQNKWSSKKYETGTYGIGEITTGIAIAIGAGVGLVSAALIYYAFKPKYDDSVANVKETTELKKALSYLSPEESQKLMSDLELQVDKAYQQGKTDQSLTGIWKNLKTIGIVVGTYLLADKLIFSKKNG
jgi:hypothetical protein